MPYNHKRSKEKFEERKRKREAALSLKEQRSFAKKLIREGIPETIDNKPTLTGASHLDKIKKETISRISSSQIEAAMKGKFDGVVVGAVPKVEAGDLLRDIYGNGLFDNPQLLWEVQ